MTGALFQVMSGACIILVLLALLRPSTFSVLIDKDSRIASLGRQAQFVALLVSTWGFAAVTVDGKLTEWYFMGYMVAWAGAQFGSRWLKVKNQQMNQPQEKIP